MVTDYPNVEGLEGLISTVIMRVISALNLQSVKIKGGDEIGTFRSVLLSLQG